MHKTERDAVICTVDPADACQSARDSGLIVVTEDPLNCETPTPAPGSGLLTPADRFYLRNHFPIPVSGRRRVAAQRQRAGARAAGAEPG